MADSQKFWDFDFDHLDGLKQLLEARRKLVDDEKMSEETFKAQLDEKDANGNTALHIFTRDDCQEHVLQMLLQGANPNVVNKEGFSPLVYAVHYHRPQAFMMLVCHRGRYQNMHLRHYVRIEGKTGNDYTEMMQIRELLSELHVEKCPLADPPGFPCTEFCKKQPNPNRAASKMCMLDLPSQPGSIASLSLDGCGMHAICNVWILRKIEHRVRLLTGDWTYNLAKSFKVFYGSSICALVSVMMANGMSLDVLWRKLFELKDTVFRGMRPYNSETLRKVIRDLLSSLKKSDDVKMGQFFSEQKLMVGVTAMDDRWRPRREVLLASHFSPADIIPAVQGLHFTQVDALQAAMSRVGYFPRFLRPGLCLVDDGTSTKNPTTMMLANVSLHNQQAVPEDRVKIGLILSIGATDATHGDGSDMLVSWGFADAIKASYFRFSPRLTKKLEGLDYDTVQTALLVRLMFEAKLYMIEHETELDNIVRKLASTDYRNSW